MPNWGCYRRELGAAEQAVGTGASNTSKILANCAEVGIAARIADNYSLNGYTTWFLPSTDELNLMYINLHLNGVGGFANDVYWSSSEGGSNYALDQLFLNGIQGGFSKDITLRVRAVRAF